MTLVVFDLDNTLVDRDETFRAWASSFVREQKGTDADEAWLLAADTGGTREFFERVHKRFGLRFPLEEFMTTYWEKHFLALFRCSDSTLKALEHLRATGFTIGIVTNGHTFNQEAKLRYARLDRLVDGRQISE